MTETMFDFWATTQRLTCSHHDEQQVREALLSAKKAGANEGEMGHRIMWEQMCNTLAVAEWALESMGGLEAFETKKSELAMNTTYLGGMKCHVTGCWRPLAYDGQCEFHANGGV